ncbi:TAF6-like RNA polymerase II p300/CBP-associated factor-associated factor 65 kDa subunit 6L [Ornithodoros turicata]|uniref:TAF6-like RNA polymerase II p300/CBP-associated factor-associated factor 65 kDa subunit 6L n=1 Tax=Ornithodoros turicata TaxID=34597 RepID=UPI003139F073
MAEARTNQENVEEKKVDEKKYSQFPRDSVRLFAEAGGHGDVSDQALSLLTEDLNYRLREVAQNSGQFMRHAKRRKLTCDDVRRALLWSDVEPIYGYGSSEPLAFHYIKEADVFCPEDREVNFQEILDLPLNLDVPTEPVVQAKWLMVEGVKPEEGYAGSCKKQIQLPVTPSHMQYYDEVTKAIFGSNEQLLQLALDDLHTNPCLAPVLPFLVNFVSIGVRKMNHDLAQLSKLLKTIHALVNNPTLFLGTKPYLTLLVQAVLYCMLEPLAASINPINDHWSLRDSAAHLLAGILKVWATPFNRIKEQVLSALQESFRDLSRPFCCHYGAIAGLVALGVETVEKHLYPSLNVYWPHLIRALGECIPSSAQVKNDAHKVYGSLLIVSELLIRFRHQKILEKGLVTEARFSTYRELYECFGDALAVRLPFVPVAKHMYQLRKELTVQLFSRDTATGEELLEAFYEAGEEERSPSPEEENSCDSILSGPPPPALDLQVKSTISDPTRGIKLTIALRRPPQEEPKASKRKKVASKAQWDPKEPVFESVPLKPRSMISINFEGAVPVPIVYKFWPHASLLAPETRAAVLARRMGKIGKKKTSRQLGPENIFRKCFSTPGLDAIL